MNPIELLERARKSLESIQSISNPYENNKMLSIADSYNTTRMLLREFMRNTGSFVPNPVKITKIGEENYQIDASYDVIKERFAELITLFEMEGLKPQ